MRRKHVLHPERLRRVPSQFSWIDQRLVRDGYIARCDVHALALYLFVVTVSDAQGLSYYGDATLCRSLSMPAPRLQQARADLIRFGLIAYEAPLYQVLSLTPTPPPRQSGTRSLHGSLEQVLHRLKGRA
ncbi:MAG TPA: hypothetical protein VJS42_11530 [Steroidobacteraceae bacterium]|nr:hypothetical protein [Steroidobacteraceae bacterium]